MDYRFYIVEGETAAKILGEYEEKRQKFDKKRKAWESANEPLRITNKADVVASYTPLLNLKAYGLKKGPAGDRKAYYYRWLKSAEKADGYKEQQEIMAIRPEFKQMVEIATNLPISRMEVMGIRIYTGTTGVVKGAEGIIFCKIPKSSEEEQEAYAAGVREIKESEWLALMGGK